MKEVVEFMRKEGRAEWLGGKGDGREVWVWWKSVDEWASAIYDWVSCEKATATDTWRIDSRKDGC